VHHPISRHVRSVTHPPDLACFPGSTASCETDAWVPAEEHPHHVLKLFLYPCLSPMSISYVNVPAHNPAAGIQAVILVEAQIREAREGHLEQEIQPVGQIPAARSLVAPHIQLD
jgi:hypothetical protein